MKLGNKTDMKSAAKTTSRLSKSDAGTIRADMLFGAGNITSDVNQQIPAFIVSDLTGICTGRPRRREHGKRIQVQLATTWYTLRHPSRSHSSVVYQAQLDVSRKHEAFRGSGANQDSRLFSIICNLSLLYMATKLFRHETLQT